MYDFIFHYSDSIKPLLKKFLKGGEEITDSELKILLNHYKPLVKYLQPHGERYQLVYRDAYENLTRIQQMIRDRKS